MTFSLKQHGAFAIDVSSSQASIAISLEGKCVAKKNWHSVRGNSGTLIQEIEKLRQQTDISWDSIDTILVGCGPGQYTGLRVSMAVAQALQLPNRGSTFGIPSAYALLKKTQTKTAATPATIACGDARRNHIWTYIWLPSSSHPFPEMQCLSKEEFADLSVPAGTRVVSPDYDRLHGNTTLPKGAQWEPEKVFPNAEDLIKLATSHPKEVLHAPEIIYVHPPVSVTPKQ